MNPILSLAGLDSRVVSWGQLESPPRLCPFCGIDDYINYCKRPDGLTVRCCNGCEGYYVSPAPTENSLLDFYTDYHSQYAMKTKYDDSVIAKSSASVVVEDDPKLLFLSKELMRQKFGEKLRLLDFGCGRGDFLVKAQALGFITEGIDLDSGAVSYCHQRGLQSVVHGGIERLNEITGNFDIVVLNDVIEHPINPVLLLQQCIGVLKPGGKILIWTPNGDSIASDPEKIALRLDLEHMQYLTSSVIAHFCASFSLKVVHYEQIGFPSKRDNSSRPIIAELNSRFRSRVKSIAVRLKIDGILRCVLRMVGLMRGYPRGGRYHLFVVLQVSSHCSLVAQTVQVE